MAEAAAVNQELSFAAEEYAHSRRNMRVMGYLALKQAMSAPEYSGARDEVYYDFKRAIGENLATDKEYGEQLEFNPLDSYVISNELMLDKTGKPMADLVRAGWMKARKAANDNPKMLIEAERAEGDVMIMQIVDKLEVGESYTVVSVEPKEQLELDPAFWQDKMHYAKGMAVVQTYYRKSKTELLAGPYSLKHSDLGALRQIFSAEGVNIPSNESPNRWSRYGIRKRVSEQAARAIGPNLVARHRLATGQTTAMFSVTELIDREEKTVLQYFNTYIEPLTEALVSGENNETMTSLSRSLLSNVNNFEVDDIHRLMRIANSKKFSEVDADFMEEKIRYALLEELRKQIPAMLHTSGVARTKVNPSTEISVPRTTGPASQMMLSILNEQASRNIASGQSAGRSYGGVGCTGAGNAKALGQFEGSDSQNVFGGNGQVNIDTEKAINVECVYTHKSCYCCPYDIDGKPLAEPLEVKARRRKDGVAECLRSGCGASLDKNGNPIKGRIYEKAMQLKRQNLKLVGKVTL